VQFVEGGRDVEEWEIGWKHSDTYN
jgi:hypothetical protein